MNDALRLLAVITGASAGIGFELATRRAQNRFDLPITDDEPAVFPVGSTGAEFCNIQPADTGRSRTRVAVRGCGPVGQMAIRSYSLLGAERVIATDTAPERLALVHAAGTETLDFLDEDSDDRRRHHNRAPTDRGGS